jgi:HEAT repeat protein
VPALVEILEGGDAGASTEAARALTRIGEPAGASAKALGAVLDSQDGLLVEASLAALSALGEEALPSVSSLCGVLSNENPHRAREAAEILGRLGPPAKAAVPQLLEALRHPYGMVVIASAQAVRRISPEAEEGLVKALAGLLKSGSDDATYNAARAARVVGPALGDGKQKGKLIKALSGILAKRRAPVMPIAAMALGDFGSAAASAVPQLHDAALGPEAKQFAREALKKIDPTINVDRIQPDTDIELDL